MIPLVEPKRETPYSRFFIGTVVDNNDPKKLGRVKVSIPLYEGIDVDYLPWAVRFSGIISGSHNEAGFFSVPDLNSLVVVFFPFIDPHQPCYIGTITNQQTFLSEFEANYPAAYGFKDEVGNLFKVNKERKTFEYEHPSGTRLFIAQDGSVTIDIQGSITWNIVGDWVANVGGNVNWNHS